MTSDVTLFHIWPSLCSQKVRLVLAEKGVPYADRLVDIGPRMQNYEPWYVRLNPAAVVPTLLHKERVVTDSARIVRYVDEAFEGPALGAADDAERAALDAWIARVDAIDFRALSYGALEGVKQRVAWLAVGARLRRLERHRARNPDLAEAYTAKIADVQAWRGSFVDAAAVARVRAEAHALLDAAEEVLATGRPWLPGERYTLADVMLTVAAARLVFLGWAGEVGARPALSRWYGRVRSRPSFQQAKLMERFHPGIMVQVIAPWLLPRLGAALALLGLGVWGLVVALR